ncbi:MAG: alpha-2-macroglobulin family protein [Bauldia sp.]|nr:alpha-2-macroglobulin family protein [Bauldia sp.]
MRNVVHAARLLFIAILIAAGSGLGAAAAETRVIVTPDADYPGFDYQTVKNVDLDACKAACVSGDQCRAFTYNTKARWCFLKTDFGTLTAAVGATAGRLVQTAELTPSLEATRLAQLDFVPGRYVDEARELAGTIKRRFPPPADGAYQALRDQGTAAYNDGSYGDAVRLFGETLAVADDNPGVWLDFAIASLARNPDDWSERQQAYRDITAASINGFVRSDTDDNQAKALALMGDGFARREEWKLSYRSYRASLALVEDASVRADYEQVIAEHGFRILSHTVDADIANPRICVVFSDDLPVSDPRLADFVTVSGGEGLAVEPERRQICVSGVVHGGRYDVRIRGGLPAADGEVLAHPVELNVYVRDRAPWVGFAGNAYVLPAGPGASIPIVSVNTDKAQATIYRIGERGVAYAVRNNQFMRTLSSWSAENIADSSGEKVWEGEILIQSELNQTITTAVPVSDAIPDLRPGIYVITAKAELDPDQWGQLATQWFVVSDLGLTALSGSDGIHAIVRSLSSAEPVAGAKLRLVAVNNDVLGEGTTDQNGYVRFDPGLARGTGGAAPQMIDATVGDGDYAFIDLTRAAFDLSDRGVDGRPSPGPLDVFVTPERGIYRPGETVHLTALVRDARAVAVTGLPLTLVVERPDGVEFLRETLSDGGLGGYSADVDLLADAMRGSWQVRLYADPKGRSVAETSVLVEDFQPERLAFELTTDAKAIGTSAPVSIDIDARYLYGATAPGLSIDGDIDIRTADSVAGFSGYHFGLADDRIEPVREPVDLGATTDEDGKATIDVALPELPSTTVPLQAQIIVRIADTNGRAVERRLTLPVTPDVPMIGIRPQFGDDEVEEGATANFDVILVDPEGQRIAGPGLAWRLERITSEYQWYRSDDNWNYEIVTSAERVATGEIDATADGPATVSANVDWGRYRLTVERMGDEPAATSYEFYAGWYVSSASSSTPDVLDVALDKPAYHVGDTARLRLDPRFAGIAVITVLDDRLITMKAVEVPEEGTSVDLEVTDQWGPGAYVTATLFRPMDIPAKRMPSRALGLTWAKVDPGDHDLAVSLGVVDEMRPRQPMTIPVAIGNLQPGTQAYVTVAAVDVGILNLTNFQSPAPDDWYFGQRKLGMDIRDLYGLLIDRMQGAPGEIRSGGDGGGVRLAAPPPTEKLVSFYSGIVEVDPEGKATVSFDMPQFNGTVRVMAMAWSRDGVGHAVKDVLVRDPVVVSASIPQFLHTGDSSRLLVEINNVAGAAGDYGLKVAAGDGIGVTASDLERTVTLAEKERQSFNIPISGDEVGDYTITVTLTTPDGESWPRELALGIRPPGQPVTRRNVVALAGGATLTVDAAPLAEFVPGTGSVGVSIGGASRLDVAGILAALDRYPYGCSEQLTSRALPLVYLNDVAVAVGAATDAEISGRVQKAIERILANQSSSGSFGLWGPYGGGNLWLDAYVTDFLTRAAEKGYEVPELSRTIALDNLSNRLSYADDFTEGGEDIAYALYVLARAGRASLGDLRYYAETKIGNFGTALAKAQIGAALALYGDRQRSSRAFEAALADLNRGRNQDYWTNDYGSQLRDTAAVLTLAAESDAGSVDIRSLASMLANEDASRRYTSTQENAWMLLAAAALIEDSARTSFEIEGATVAGPLYKEYAQATLEAAPVAIKNLGADTLDAVLATTGVPVVPEPAGGDGFTIERFTYTVDGEPTDIAAVGQNERIVVVLTVTADLGRSGNIMIVDPIPAGYEIENPNISASGDVTNFGWLDVDRDVDHTEARVDRFVAAMERSSGDPLQFSVAYSMRAVSPGVFAQAAATVEDMYRPYLNARTDTGTVEVVGPTR